MLSTDRSPSQTVRPSVPMPWFTFILAGGILAISSLSFYLTAAALPLYLHDLGAAEGRIGVEVGLGNFTGLAITLVLGPAINRRGPVLFIRAGAVLYLLSAMGMLLFGHEATVAVFRALQGIGPALISPSVFVLGTRLFPRRAGTVVGLLGMLNSAALAIGPPVGLALYAAHGALWLFLPAAGTAGLGLLGSMLLPHVPRAGEPARGFGFDRSWTPSLVANCLAAMYFGGIVAYLPLILQQAHGPNAGIFFTADAIGVLLLRVPTGILTDRRGSLLPKLLGIAITLPGIGVLALTPSIIALVIAGACTGIGAGLFITGVLSDLSRSSSDANRGTAMSLGSGSFSAAIFLGSAISGLLIGPGGFNAILLFGILTSLAAVPFALTRAPRSTFRP